MYYLVKQSIPFLEKYSFWISIILFITWLFQRKNKHYIAHLSRKAMRKYAGKIEEVNLYNFQNPSHKVELSSSWLDLYKSYWSRTNSTLLLSIVFAYVSFNTSAYLHVDNTNFFKLLTISTSLFLAGITYIQQLYRE